MVRRSSNADERPSPRGARRVRRHVLIGITATGTTGLLSTVMAGPARERLSLSTAYVALVLLVITLILGPINVLRGLPNPVSFDRRRDVGIWAAVFSVAHTAIGLTVHFGGRMREYFLASPGVRGVFGMRVDPFGLTNYAGLLAVLLLLLLSAISNDYALRTMGTRPWRFVQRWAYAAVGLTIAHGIVYQILEKQRAVLVAVFALMSVTLVGMQLTGRRQFLDSVRVRTDVRAREALPSVDVDR